jgi:hypothetical protein
MTPPSHTSPEVKTLALAGEQVTLPSLTLPSLMAGKLHILLTRLDREKGRDWFDYLWYRKNGVTPNVLQLQSAIDQTNPGLDAIYWMSHIRAKAKAVNWENIRADVSPFLENQEEAKGLSEAKVSVHTPYPDFSALGVEVASANPSHRVFRRGDYVRADIDQAAMEGLEEAMDLRKAIFDREIRSRVGGPDLVG